MSDIELTAGRMLRYAELDETTDGQVGAILHELTRFAPLLSEKFQFALNEEIESRLKRYQREYTIQTESKKVTVRDSRLVKL